jgi:two-component system KDP operon response regulator KdpE
MTEFIACVLIVEDREALHRLLRTSLTVTEYTDLATTSGQERLATMAAGKAALIALELSFEEGLKLRSQPHDRSQIPVMLFAMHEQGPFNLRMLNDGEDGHSTTSESGVGDEERVLDANPARDEGVFHVHELTIDRPRRRVTLGKKEIHLTPTEYELLCLLAAQAGAVLPHERILQELWGAANAHTVHLLRVNISNLRRKLDFEPTSPRYITTEPGIGYRLRAEL